MICPNCKNEILNNNGICPKCGTNLNGNLSQPPQIQNNIDVEDIFGVSMQPQTTMNNETPNILENTATNEEVIDILEDTQQTTMHNEVPNLLVTSQQSPINNGAPDLLGSTQQSPINNGAPDLLGIPQQTTMNNETPNLLVTSQQSPINNEKPDLLGSTQQSPINNETPDLLGIPQKPPINNETAELLGKPVTNSEEKNDIKSKKQNNNAIKILIIGIILVILIVVGIIVYNKFINNDLPLTNETETSESTNVTVDPNTNLTYDKNGAFLMHIGKAEDSEEGVYLTGKIERGTIKKNDTVQIIGLNKNVKTTKIAGIEQNGQKKDSAEIEEEVSLLIKDIKKKDIEIGQVVAKPNSIRTAQKFEADVYAFTEEKGNTIEIVNDFRTQFYFITTDVTGKITLPENVDKIMPGENSTITVELSTSVPMEEGMEITIRNAGRTIANCKITKIY